LSQNPSIEIAENPKNGYRYLVFNMERPPLDDLAMRQAINCMVDKRFLTESLMQGQALPVWTPVPQGNAFWYKPDVTIYCQGMSGQERLEEAVPSSPRRVTPGTSRLLGTRNGAARWTGAKVSRCPTVSTRPR
jgi:ABC-type transport system substrate-binding protein